MKSKKTLALLLTLCLCLTIAACGDGDPSSQAGASVADSASSAVSSETGAPSSSDTASEVSSSQAGESKSSGSYPVTISNFNYAKEPVEYTYEKAPERVITFWTNSLEIMLALGLEDRVICAVGMEEESVLPELQGELKKCTDQMEYYNDFKDSNAALSKESAVMMEPDFILGWKSTFSDKTIGDVDYWNENGVGTYMALNSNDISENRTLENEYADILNIGKIFGVEEKAQALVDDMKAEVEKITAATQGQEVQTVMVIEFMKDNIWAYDKTMLVGDMVQAMGGELLETGEDLGAEDVVAADPQVILIIGDQEDADSLCNGPAYASLQAVQNKRVYPIDLSEVYTSGVRTGMGLNHIGRALYPELYEEAE